MYKFFLLFSFFLVAQAFTPEYQEQIKANSDACASETGIDQDLLTKLRAGDYSSEEPKLKTFTVCLAKKAEIFDAEGTIKNDLVITKLTEEEREEANGIIKTCTKDIPKVNNDNAWDVLKCIYSENPKYSVV